MAIPRCPLTRLGVRRRRERPRATRSSRGLRAGRVRPVGIDRRMSRGPPCVRPGLRRRYEARAPPAQLELRARRRRGRGEETVRPGRLPGWPPRRARRESRGARRVPGTPGRESRGARRVPGTPRRESRRARRVPGTPRRESRRASRKGERPGTRRTRCGLPCARLGRSRPWRVGRLDRRPARRRGPVGPHRARVADKPTARASRGRVPGGMRAPTARVGCRRI